MRKLILALVVCLVGCRNLERCPTPTQQRCRANRVETCSTDGTYLEEATSDCNRMLPRSRNWTCCPPVGGDQLACRPATECDPSFVSTGQ